MLELVVIGSFFTVLFVCVILDYSILYALSAGYALFFTYGLIRGFTAMGIIKMSWDGIKTVKNILVTFLLIGMLTAVWRDCGTIPYIIYHSSGLITPSVFILMSFLLCCLISVLTGTAFGTAATIGVICMTLGNAMGINPVLAGGAILSGVFFGDRCSPMSTSALLVSELTGTDIYLNVKNMIRTSIVPFAAAGALYLVLGINHDNEPASIEIWNLFSDNFNLKGIVTLPALLIIVLCVVRVKVKKAMLVSVAAGSMISIFVQNTSPAELLKLLMAGFQSPDQQLAAMMNGGGIVSMVKVAAIVCLSSCYAGIFEKTGLLNGIRAQIAELSNKLTPYGGLLVSSVLTSMVACNQTLAIMLTHYLCKDTMPDRRQFAINLENTVVVISPLIPWSIACAVPLASVGAPVSSVLAAFYLYLLPLWNLFHQKRTGAGQLSLAASSEAKSTEAQA
ncbi:sodium:proton antiporter [Deltaproteobacteria bacterium Smac51]|nr:sodium:proton antiporter [Deltaproteobacteria bacterium Smac51]